MATTPWYDFPTTQGYGVNGERGIDIGTPLNTPLTALYGGTVVAEGYQPWGGEVDILANVPGVGRVVEYFLHLNDIAGGIVTGATVKAGQVLGFSGGQTSGGDHPTSPQFSTGPHTEFGLVPDTASHSAFAGVSDNPTASIAAARNGTLGTGGAGVTQTGTPLPVAALGGVAGTLGGAAQGALGLTSGAISAVVSALVTLSERIGLFLLALMALGFGLLLLLWAPNSDTVKRLAGTVAEAG